MNKIILIGGGGREHAIANQLRKDAPKAKLYVIPGNAGIAMIPNTECVPIAATDINGIMNFAREQAPDLVFVAPDDPIALGLVDRLHDAGIRAFGPTQAAGEVEWSKAFSKDFMQRHNIPTAKYGTFIDFELAKRYVETMTPPIVLKASGLALGKGVIISYSVCDAIVSLKEMMLNKKFGAASSTVVIEEFMEGTEVTLLAFVDGENFAIMPTSQDHKRAFDNDQGPNTGGMGCFSPAKALPTISPDHDVIKTIVEPTIQGLIKEGRVYKGVIYFGLMVTERGTKVVEYNARFGDPECQTILPLLKTNFIDIIDACIDGTLDKIDIKWEDKAALCVVIASKEYPEAVRKGYPITIGDLHKDVTLIHCATLRTDECTEFANDNELVTNGGRVLNVTTISDTIEKARNLVYNEIDKVTFEGARYRTDIGA